MIRPAFKDHDKFCYFLQRDAAIEKYQVARDEMLHNERQAEIKKEDEIKRLHELEKHKVCVTERIK